MKEVLTTGDVASLCQVSPNTVKQWFDGGGLKGYKIPGSGGDRRIPLKDLVRFLTERGMPVDVSLRKFVLWGEGSIIQDIRGELERIVGETGEVQVVEDAFSAGLEMHDADYLVFEEASGSDSDQVIASLEQNGKSGRLISSADAPDMIVSEIKKQLEQQSGNSAQDARPRKVA